VLPANAFQRPVPEGVLPEPNREAPHFLHIYLDASLLEQSSSGDVRGSPSVSQKHHFSLKCENLSDGEARLKRLLEFMKEL
jgi:hypothetical protein